jgi:hypothetical protein
MDAPLNVKQLGQTLVASVRSRFGGFLNENAAAAALVERVGADYANLAAQYHLATDEETKIGVLTELRRVENTLELEADALAELAGAQLIEQLKSALGVVLNFAIQNLPTLLAAIPK